MSNEIQVVITDLEESKGFVHENRDGTYTIFINAKLNKEQQIEVFNHEMHHIMNKDFEKRDEKNVNELENAAHAI